MDQHEIFNDFTLGNLKLNNRFVMAPLTRSRSNDEGTATSLMAKYYAQRAEAGLIISEATNISQQAYGYALTPGIYTDAQRDSWKQVTESVHAKGGKIFCQLWHCGRISHSDLQPNNQKPVSASALKADAQAFTKDGKKDAEEPRALSREEIAQTVQDYKKAAQNAKDAGFDGIEIHSANGYLLQQFIANNSNQRDDNYGGPIENRVRIVLEVVDACLEVWAADRVGIRLSPVSPFNDTASEDPQKDYDYLCQKLGERKLAYLHVIEGATMQARDFKAEFKYSSLKSKFAGTYMSNNCLSLELAKTQLERGEKDLFCFGRKFISNPDLVTRFKQGAELNKPDPDSFYGGDERGYTDYPFLSV